MLMASAEGYIAVYGEKVGRWLISSNRDENGQGAIVKWILARSFACPLPDISPGISF